ncbi:MAG: H+/gluconate symporter [Verrucomicrobia bacterium]|nr:MAG: H+/gluconate symporter [Verrucomicrobiota bacterium]
MLAAYRGYSVILCAPVAAMGAVLFSHPTLVPALFNGLFMERMVGFVKNFFPIFLLGAVFGKVIELSGFSRSIVATVIKFFGSRRAMLSIVLVGALLTYGGVSLFVVVFSVYPFAAELFKKSGIPKRLMPATIALGAFTFTMDSLPGTPQIQNIIPTTFFKTSVYAGPWLGTVGGVFILVCGMVYLERRRLVALRCGEGYGEGHSNEPTGGAGAISVHSGIALIPLVVVGVMNRVFTEAIPAFYGESVSFFAGVVGKVEPIVLQTKSVTAIWAIEGALLLGIATVFALAWKRLVPSFLEGSKTAVSGALLATMNTASEYGFGAIVAALPGFLLVSELLKSVPNVLVNEAVTVTALAGLTGSASAGLGIALASMAEHFCIAAQSAGIPLEVLHRVASMASGGMDTLPHNGAVITLLAVTGLTHREAYRDIFVITCIKTVAVFLVIGVFYATGIV